MAQRFDLAQIKATRTDEGYIKDTPVITRTGVFPYRQPDGTVRYELRLPEEVFHADSLNTLTGVPITNGHHGLVDAKTVKQHSIGVILGNARQDGDNLIADIVIHAPDVVDAGNKELSCGYECDLEEVAGEWQGHRYDAIQRNIRHNHLAVVGKGRAGNARLNLDAADAAFFNGGDSMGKVRLDNGIEYDAAQEVVQAFNQLKQDKEELAKEKQAVEDSLAATKDELKDLQDKQPEIEQAARDAAKARAELESVAKEYGVEVKDEQSERDIKEAVIKAAGTDIDLSGKSDEYVAAAFDIALASKKPTEQTASMQRADMADKSKDKQAQCGVSAAEARKQMIKKGK